VSDEYPKALYRDGGEDLIWGKPVKMLVVETAEEEEKALADGWRLSPIPTDPETLAPVQRKVRTKTNGAELPHRP